MLLAFELIMSVSRTLIEECSDGNTDAVKAKIANFLVDININDNNNGVTPLWIASQKGHLEIIKVLIAAGADMIKSDNNGVTPLHIASQNGHLEIVKFLVRINGIEVVNQADDNGDTPLTAAIDSEHLEIINVLKAVQPTIFVKELIRACGQGNVRRVTLIIEQEAIDINAKYGLYEDTALIKSSENGHIEVVKILLAADAEVNQADKNGVTALSFAIANGHVNVVEALLTAGASANQANNVNVTPFCVACKRDDVDLLNLLLSKGALINQTNNRGTTPLFSAIYSNRLDLGKG